MFLDWLVRLIIAGLGLLSAACYAQTSTCGVTMQTAQSNFRNIDVPGAQSTFASGINNSGTIVGTFADAAETLGRTSFSIEKLSAGSLSCIT